MSESSYIVPFAPRGRTEIAWEAIAMSDPRVRAVRVSDCAEPLVSLLDDDRFLIDGRKSTTSGTFAMIRSGLVDQLWMAEEYLRERGHRLRIVECYRPPTRQSQSFQRELSRIAADHPGLNSEQLISLAGRHVSPPWIAPHSCGGAIDVTLASLDGTELDIGCRANVQSKEPDKISFLATQDLPEHVRANRMLLLSAMEHGGWVSHWYESWHFEIGTRFAALLTGWDEAVYGVISDPHADALWISG